MSQDRTPLASQRHLAVNDVPSPYNSPLYWNRDVANSAAAPGSAAAGGAGGNATSQADFARTFQMLQQEQQHHQQEEQAMLLAQLQHQHNQQQQQQQQHHMLQSLQQAASQAQARESDARRTIARAAGQPNVMQLASNLLQFDADAVNAATPIPRHDHQFQALEDTQGDTTTGPESADSTEQSDHESVTTDQTDHSIDLGVRGIALQDVLRKNHLQVTTAGGEDRTPQAPMRRVNSDNSNSQRVPLQQQQQQQLHQQHQQQQQQALSPQQAALRGDGHRKQPSGEFRYQ